MHTLEPERDMHHTTGMPLGEIVFISIMFGYATGMYYLFVLAAKKHRWWLAVLATWLASPLLQILTSVFIERRSPIPLFDPATASWTFIFGHVFLLAAVGGIAAWAWRFIDPKQQWHHQHWWLIACGVLAIGAAFWWHGTQVAALNGAGLGALADSPTELAHDFSDLVALTAGLVYLGIPVFITTIRRPNKQLIIAGLVIVALLIAWYGLQIRDAADLDIKNLHPAWSWTNK